MFCSNCGQELAPEAKFCSNCGAPVQPGASGARVPGSSRDSDRDWGGYSNVDDSPPEETTEVSSPPPPPSDEPYDGGPIADRKPTWEVERQRLRENDEWSLPDLGPPPAPRRRRTWLWILLGMISLAIIACCVFMFWVLGTESGTEWFEGIATQAAESLEATQQAEDAATPVP